MELASYNRAGREDRVVVCLFPHFSVDNYFAAVAGE